MSFPTLESRVEWLEERVKELMNEKRERDRIADAEEIGQQVHEKFKKALEDVQEEVRMLDRRTCGLSWWHVYR